MEKVSPKLGRLVVISGASAGAGKDTILKLFLQNHPDWHNPPSVTTRKPRPGEREGEDYYFVAKSIFEIRRKAGDFLETDYHAGNWYGTLKEPIDKILSTHQKAIVIKDVNGALEIKKKIPKATVIFIDVERPSVLEARIRGRKTESEAEIRRRLSLAKKEREFKKHFDHVVVNVQDRADEALSDIEKALKI